MAEPRWKCSGLAPSRAGRDRKRYGVDLNGDERDLPRDDGMETEEKRNAGREAKFKATDLQRMSGQGTDETEDI